MKRVKKSKTIILLLVLLGATVTVGLFFGAKWANAQYHQHKIKHLLSTELDKIDAPIKQMGFNDSKLRTGCFKAVKGNSCTADTGSYVKFANLKIVNPNAQQLSQLLDANGWHQRSDYPTIAWFKKISQGVDYQPDQLNTKTIGDATCFLDFFTAFSKPEKPAVSMSAYCVDNINFGQKS